HVSDRADSDRQNDSIFHPISHGVRKDEIRTWSSTAASATSDRGQRDNRPRPALTQRAGSTNTVMKPTADSDAPPARRYATCSTPTNPCDGVMVTCVRSLLSAIAR